MMKCINLFKDEELLFLLKNDKIKVQKEDILWEIVKDRVETISRKNSNASKTNNQNEMIKSSFLGIIQRIYFND